MISKTDILEILKHPLFLLLVTALITQYLIPHITRRWQDHQKEIELKTGLVSEISESVLKVVIGTQFAELGAKSQSQEEFDSYFREWEIQRAVIGSKIRGYFSDADLGTEWDAFSEIVTEVYALAGTTDPTFRKERLGKLRVYFSGYAVEWGTLENLELKSGGFQKFQSFMQAWFGLKDALLQRNRNMIQRILNSHMPMFK